VAAKNPSEADRNFAYYFRESLSVVTSAHLLASRDGERRILLYEPPVKLERKSGDPLHLAVTQTYKIVSTAGGYKAQSTGYTYELYAGASDELKSILEFHWHPETTHNLRWPHLHLNADGPDGNLRRKHFPTARTAIEDFLRLLIRDFEVKPRLSHSEWKEILTRNKSAFANSATWLYWKSLI
jgi:hypothetical protein